VMGFAGYRGMPDTLHVYLDSFFIDKYELTNIKFAYFLSQGNDTFYSTDTSNIEIKKINNAYHAQTGKENYPTRFISWEAANAYCKSLGKRLPTTAEWEKAARGTDGRLYVWGDQLPDTNSANYDYHCDNNYLIQFPDTLRSRICYEGAMTKGTRPVGSFPKDISPYGAYDMSGNTSEWVSDWVILNYWALPDARRNPQGPSSPTSFKKQIRGGGCDYDGPSLQLYLIFLSGWKANNYSGARCVY
jgi:eukaryotic-like serine/threonine-protein kinase